MTRDELIQALQDHLDPRDEVVVQLGMGAFEVERVDPPALQQHELRAGRLVCRPSA
jgi:hypothetical protein